MKIKKRNRPICREGNLHLCKFVDELIPLFLLILNNNKGTSWLNEKGNEFVLLRISYYLAKSRWRRAKGKFRTKNSHLLF